MNRIAVIAIIGSTFANILSAEAADNLHCVAPYQKITGGLAGDVPNVIEYADPLMGRERAQKLERAPQQAP